jgi:hypothetical protein
MSSVIPVFLRVESVNVRLLQGVVFSFFHCFFISKMRNGSFFWLKEIDIFQGNIYPFITLLLLGPVGSWQKGAPILPPFFPFYLVNTSGTRPAPVDEQN